MVRFPSKPWLIALALVLACAAALYTLFAYRNSNPWDASHMTAALPIEDAVVVYLDIAALRRAGLLTTIAGSKALEDPEYRKFITDSGFDYKSDLDRLTLAFQGQFRYAVAAGRFDWGKVRNYALQSGGQCKNGFCEVKSNEFTDRSVSFFPMQSSAMAIASGPGSGAAYSIGNTQQARNAAIVNTWPAASGPAPLWVRVPGSTWRDPAAVPTGSRIFASALVPAVNTFFAISPGEAQGNFRLSLDAVCNNAADSEKIKRDLEEATSLLKKLLAREKQTPGPADLATLLTNGAFRVDGNTAHGEWPLPMALIEAVAGGGVQ